MTTPVIDYTYWEDLAKFIEGYLECALWSSTAGDETPLDDLYDIHDIEQEWIKDAINDCYEFTYHHQDLIFATGQAHYGMHGHDFWLTRNHHGTGFWDRGYGEGIGRQLTDAAKVYGECNLAPWDMIDIDDEEMDARRGHA